jgi:hypothetical protein
LVKQLIQIDLLDIDSSPPKVDAIQALPPDC